jgi:PAS domain S-box-containing protein
MNIPSFDFPGLETREDLAGFLAGVLESSTEYSIIAIGSDGRIVLWNEGARRLYGYEPAEIVGQPHTVLHTEEDARAGLPEQMMERVLREGKFEGTVERRRKDGSRFTARVVKTPRRDAHGQLTGFLLISRDMTDEIRLAEIQRAKDEADAANRAKNEFLSRMSHELRTPLNSILGFGQLLERSAAGERQQRHAEYVLKAGRHLLTLIDEVLEISRIESGNLSLSVEPALLAQGVQDALDLVGPLADHRGISIDTQLCEVAGAHVLADSQRLKQILLNVLSNAVKYNRTDGSVRVSATVEDEAIVIRVSDTGPGIAAEDLPRLFVPFDRLGAEASEIEGTGLGLALSRGLAEAMGGTLDATSEVGTGSTFELRLATSEPKVAFGPERARPGNAAPRLPACRVLYVEDNVSNLRLVEEVLADDNVEIIAAATGRIALDLAPGANADVILLDMNLPDMTGDDVLRELRACPDTAATPVIVLTADATTGTRRLMRELGASAHLTKPIDIDLLRTTLADNTRISVSKPTDGPR